MASMDVPAGRPVAVPAAKAVVAKPTYITWLTLAFMTTGRFGVPIEDIVVAPEDGGRRLNNTSREMRIVG